MSSKARLIAFGLTATLLLTIPHMSTAEAQSSLLPDRLLVGFFQQDLAGDEAAVQTLQAQIGGRIDIVMWYKSWHWGSFDEEAIRGILERGSVPLVTWEPWRPGYGATQPDYQLSDIAQGKYDSYLMSWADAAKQIPGEIWLRPMHEMNGRWYPWGGTVNGNAPQDFVGAWRHIRQVFVSRGAQNVKFVWSPNHESVPNTADNAIVNYWPGDEYVDLVALDGYNWGTTQSWSRWKSFGEIFRPAYTIVTSLTDKPVLIGEVASTSVGGDKAAWITDMFRATREEFPRIRGIIWFNENKEADWRIDSSAASLEAFRAAVQQIRRIPSALTAQTSADSLGFGQTLAVTAGLVPVHSGVNVSLQYRKSGATEWQTVATAATDSDGIAVFTARPRRSGDYRAAWAGDSDHAAAVSAPVHVTVNARLTIKRTLPIVRGSRVRLAGRALPGTRGRTVYIQVWQGGRWKNIRAVRLNRYRRWAYTITRRSGRTYRVRAYMPGTRTYGKGVSRALTL